MEPLQCHGYDIDVVTPTRDASSKNRLKIIIIGYRDAALFPHILFVQVQLKDITKRICL